MNLSASSEGGDLPLRITGKEQEPLAEEARRIVRAEMVRRGISFRDLAEALEAQGDGGPVESVQTLINKINRGRFSFAFFLRVSRALGLKSVDLARIPDAAEQAPRSA